MPRETTKSGSLIEGNLAVASKRAEISGSFSSGPASWNVPTPLMCFGGKNLCECETFRSKKEGGELSYPGAADTARALYCVSTPLRC